MASIFSDDAPDRKYWTAYDHFMIEREARERRRAYVYALIGSAWRATKRAAVRFVNSAATGSRQVRPQA